MLCTEPTLDARALRSLADTIDAALYRGAPSHAGGGVLLRVVPDDDSGGDAAGGGPRGGELGILSLDGGHPLDGLLGLVAPPAWAALGVSGPGDGRALDDDEPAERVHVTMLLARSGASAGVLRRDGRPPTRLDEPPQGRVADACRRALGLPTAPPPPGGTGPLWTRWWLDRLVEKATEQGEMGPVLGWAEAVALHPATFVPLPTGSPPATVGPAQTDRSPGHDHPPTHVPQPASPSPAVGATANPPSASRPPGSDHPATVVPQPAGANPADEPTAGLAPTGPLAEHDSPADEPTAGLAPTGPLAEHDSPAGRRTVETAAGRPLLSLAAPAPEPAAVAAAARALADAWTWGRLRAEPHVASFPAPSVSRQVIEWMDDGMFARWLLSAFPPAGDLLDACRALLPEGVAARVAAVVAATLDQPVADR